MRRMGERALFCEEVWGDKLARSGRRAGEVGRSCCIQLPAALCARFRDRPDTPHKAQEPTRPPGMVLTRLTHCIRTTAGRPCGRTSAEVCGQRSRQQGRRACWRTDRAHRPVISTALRVWGVAGTPQVKTK